VRKGEVPVREGLRKVSGGCGNGGISDTGFQESEIDMRWYGDRDWLDWAYRPCRSGRGSKGMVIRKENKYYWVLTMCKHLCCHITFTTTLNRFYYSSSMAKEC
jgi:hypothetical protein